MRDDRLSDVIRKSRRQRVGHHIDGPQPDLRKLNDGLRPDFGWNLRSVGRLLEMLQLDLVETLVPPFAY